MADLGEVRRISGVATLLRVQTPLIALCALIGPLVYWFGRMNVIGDNFIVFASAPPRPGAEVFGYLTGAPTSVLWCYALYRLWRLAGRLASDPFVDERGARDLQMFALFTILATVFDIATSGARRWARGEFDDAPLYSHINLNTEHMTLIFTSVIFYGVSFILVEGARLRRETESYL